MRFVPLLIGLLLFLCAPRGALAVDAQVADCEFVGDFASFRDAVGHEIVGDCLENERITEHGRTQITTKGVFYFYSWEYEEGKYTDEVRFLLCSPICLFKLTPAGITAQCIAASMPPLTVPAPAPTPTG